jgi:subtilisin family serine protease
MLALVIFLMAFPFEQRIISTARAESSKSKPHKKVSDDLLDESGKRVRQGRGQELIPVIIQTPDTNTLPSTLGKMGGRINRSFRKLRAMSAQLPAQAVAALASRADISYISADRQTQVTGHLEATTGADQARAYQGADTGAIDGSGVGIAILDSGIYTQHKSFDTRIVASVDFTGENRTDDPYGHGTHVASIAAGNSMIAWGAYTGIAPAAKIINVRVLDSQGRGSVSAALAGIDWCITNKATYNIRVLNMSFGTTAVDSYLYDPLCQAVRQAFYNGLVVCVAAGNLGKDEQGAKIYGAVHSPGIEPSAITVGAVNTRGTKSRADDIVTSYSSRGPTRAHWTDSEGVKHYYNLINPYLISPGNKIISGISQVLNIVT